MVVYVLESSEYILKENFTDLWVEGIFSTYEDGKKVIDEILLPKFKEDYSEDWNDIETETYESGKIGAEYEILGFGKCKTTEDNSLREIFSFFLRRYRVLEKVEDFNS